MFAFMPPQPRHRSMAKGAYKSILPIKHSSLFDAIWCVVYTKNAYTQQPKAIKQSSIISRAWCSGRVRTQLKPTALSQFMLPKEHGELLKWEVPSHIYYIQHNPPTQNKNRAGRVPMRRRRSLARLHFVAYYAYIVYAVYAIADNKNSF